MDVSLPTILLTLALLLVGVSMVQPVARRLALPETVLLALFGIVIGFGAGILLATPRTHVFDRAARAVIGLPITSEAVLSIFLPILVFAGALSIDVRRLAHDATSVLVLAVVAVVASTALIGLALYPFAGTSLAVCLLLGAIVANTDPSATIAIFRAIGAPGRLARLVEGEALLNDATAISIFFILLDVITAGSAIDPLAAVRLFAVSFTGALAVGVALGAAMLVLITYAGETLAGEVTLTLALPFIAYVVCEHWLHLSGVVAVAASGLTFSMYGPSTMRPHVWRFLIDLWEQLAFWAGSLVFVLASILVPRLLLGATWRDGLLVLLALLAGLGARAAILFGLLPLLERVGLSRPVSNAFKVTMLWGGLRGAITLALALAVTESADISVAIKHFVAVVTTGFVLITLLVNGTTLRFLVVFLRLDQLSARDEALRHQVLAIGLGEVREKTTLRARELGFSDGATRHVVGTIEERIRNEAEVNSFDQVVSDRDRIAMALITIASRERAMLVDLFGFRGVTPGVIRKLIRTADGMVDGARTDGRLGYVRAARRRLATGPGYRVAEALHRYLRIDLPMRRQMTARYELLLIAHLVSLVLRRFMHERVEPVLGVRIAEIVSEVLDRRQKLIGAALDAMRLHYPGYAEALEGRVLRMIMLRLEAAEYDGMRDESLIGDELHVELLRDLDMRRRRLARRLHLDLQAGVDSRTAAFALFQGLPEAVQHQAASLLSIRFAVPGQVLLRRGRRPGMVILVSFGALECRVGEADRVFGQGDAIGAGEALDRQPMPATLRCSAFSHLLVMSARSFRGLAREHPALRDNVRSLGRGEGAALIGAPGRIGDGAAATG